MRVNARTLTPRATLLLSEQINETGAKDAKKGGAADEMPDARSNLLEIMAAGDSPSRDSKDSDDDDENFSTRKTKKSKVETWKEDSKKYNVPFVGTSTRKGATGVVTRKQWPTGFLEAYLQSSPSAIEILGPDFQRLLSRGTKTLQFIFLEAMSELVSSNIDSEKISLMENIFDIDAESYYKADATSDSKYTKLVSIVMKDHLKTVFDILNEHAFNSTGHRLILASLNFHFLMFRNLDF